MSTLPRATASIDNVIHSVQLLLTDPKYFWTFASLIIIGDAVITELIIHFVPCQRLVLLSFEANPNMNSQTRKSTGKLI
jgi:hypothetical protein